MIQRKHYNTNIESGIMLRGRSDELLNRELFYSLKEAQILIEQYRLEYNTVRPHSRLNHLTPSEFTHQYNENNPILSLNLV